MTVRTDSRTVLWEGRGDQADTRREAKAFDAHFVALSESGREKITSFLKAIGVAEG